ncbi:zf-HC2 domain-containing protein [Candidatus Chlorohelix sp.]|uniref:zf-HC2 domain-containing protein n=1 Tax=Candidatus Chlorohelix sp. TaxID=3139201 RepID=UPI003048DEB7
MSQLTKTPHKLHQREAEQLISLYQDGEASPAQQQQVEEFILACSSCRNTLNEYRLVNARLGEYMGNVAVSSATTLLENLEKQRIPSKIAQPTRLRLPNNNGFRQVVAYSALLLVTLIGFFLLIYQTQKQSEQIIPTVTPVPTPIANTLQPYSSTAADISPVLDKPLIPSPSVAPAKVPVVPVPTSVINPKPSASVAPTSVSDKTFAAGWIAYIGKEDGEIYLTRSDGSIKVQLSQKSAESKVQWLQLVWSNNSKGLAAVGYQIDNRKYGIYRFRVDNPPVAQAAPDNFVGEGIAPVWSPSDSKITFLAGPIRDSGNGILKGQPALLDMKNSAALILNQEYTTLTPQWFDDEKRVLLGQNRVVKLDGSAIGSFDIFDNLCVAASLSPKGNKLVVLEYTGSGFRPVLYDLNQGITGVLKPTFTFKTIFTGSLGRGTDCGSNRIAWTSDSSGFYFYMTEGGLPQTCWANPASGQFQCLRNVINPGFSFDASAYADFNPQTGQIYTALFGDRPSNPRIIAESKVPPVWQPGL